MARRPGLLGRIWQNFRNSLGAPLQKTGCVGEDHLGNKYFEKQPDPSRSLRGGRWVEPGDGDQFAAPEVPVEWEAWLRFKRQTPPSEEELMENYVKMMKVQARAREIEKKDPDITNLGNESSSLTSEIKPDSSTSKFPTYDDFEIIPGQKTSRQKPKNS